MLHTRLRLLSGPYFTICNDWNFELIKCFYLFPIGRRLIALSFGTSMNSQPICTAVSDSTTNIIHSTGIGIAQANLGRYWNMSRYGFTHGTDNLVHDFWLVQQHRAATMIINGLRRATKVDIDSRRTKLTTQGGALSHQLRFTAQKLDVDRRAGFGLGIVIKLGYIFIKHMGWQQVLGNSNKFTD